jgi:SAM-dependent methyltransferase
MRIFAAPLIIIGPQVNLTTVFAAPPSPGNATNKSVKTRLHRGLCPDGTGVIGARSQERSARELFEANRRYYDALWSGARLVEARRFNTWPLVDSLLPQAPRRLEVAPGLRPRLPIKGTEFLDISAPALALLQRRGGHAVCGTVTLLPYADRTFDLVCALDIVEHLDDDAAAWSELARVAKPGAVLLLSVPLHPSRWTAFDDFVGHKRRYEPQELQRRLAEHSLVVERSAVYGMQPRSSRLLDLGMWWLTHHRAWAMWWYNRVIMPLGVLSQSKLVLTTGMLAPQDVDEVLLVCRKESSD